MSQEQYVYKGIKNRIPDIDQKITQVTMNEEFKKIFPEAMFIPYNKSCYGKVWPIGGATLW